MAIKRPSITSICHWEVEMMTAHNAFFETLSSELCMMDCLLLLKTHKIPTSAFIAARQFVGWQQGFSKGEVNKAFLNISDNTLFVVKVRHENMSLQHIVK